MSRGNIVFAVAFSVFAITVVVFLRDAYGERILPVQPVKYNHAKHIKLGMECAACHTGAYDSDRAVIPEAQKCGFCHKPDRDFPPTSSSLAQYIEEGEIPWIQLHKVPRHVYFSHRRHTKLGGLDCSVCHGDVKSMEQPFVKRYFPAGLDGMNRCVECHRKEHVSTDCLGCHR